MAEFLILHGRFSVRIEQFVKQFQSHFHVWKSVRTGVDKFKCHLKKFLLLHNLKISRLLKTIFQCDVSTFPPLTSFLIASACVPAFRREFMPHD
jgi:hypothetical protein